MADTIKKIEKEVKKDAVAFEESVLERLETIDNQLTRLGITEYMNYLRSPGRILWNNLLAGIARGLGLVLGATVVVAVIVFILSYLTGIPLIGQWIQQLRELVQRQVIR